MEARLALKNKSIIIKNDLSQLEVQPNRVIGFGGSCIVYLGKKTDIMNGKPVESSVIIKEFFPSELGITRHENGNLIIPNQEKYNLMKEHFIDGQALHKEFYERVPNQVLPREFFHGIANNSFYFVSDHGKGETLSTIHSTDLSLKNIASIMKSLYSAITTLHKMGYLYLDCKPDNFFYSGDGESSTIFLFDFDTVVKSDLIKNRQYKYCSASEDWVPEEQRLVKDPITDNLRYNKDYLIGKHTDLFSIGAVFFWLLTQRPPSSKDLIRIQNDAVNWTDESRYFIREKTITQEITQRILKKLLQPDAKKRKKALKAESVSNDIIDDFSKLFRVAKGKETSSNDPFPPIRHDYTKQIQMNYGTETNLPDFQGKLQLRNSIPEIKEEYTDLTDLISDYTQLSSGTNQRQDIRFLLSGDTNSSQTTLFFHYWQVTIQNRSRIVFYIPCRSLNDDGLFGYIYKQYLKNLRDFEDLSPEESFHKLKEIRNERILILVDDYYRSSKSLKEKLDRVFKHEDPLISNVDIIINTREKEDGWPQNYQIISIIDSKRDLSPDRFINRLKKYINQSIIPLMLLTLTMVILYIILDIAGITTAELLGKTVNSKSVRIIFSLFLLLLSVLPIIAGMTYDRRIAIKEFRKKNATEEKNTDPDWIVRSYSRRFDPDRDQVIIYTLSNVIGAFSSIALIILVQTSDGINEYISSSMPSFIFPLFFFFGLTVALFMNFNLSTIPAVHRDPEIYRLNRAHAFLNTLYLSIDLPVSCIFCYAFFSYSIARHNAFHLNYPFSLAVLVFFIFLWINTCSPWEDIIDPVSEKNFTAGVPILTAVALAFTIYCFEWSVPTFLAIATTIFCLISWISYFRKKERRIIGKFKPSFFTCLAGIVILLLGIEMFA